MQNREKSHIYHGEGRSRSINRLQNNKIYEKNRYNEQNEEIPKGMKLTIIAIHSLLGKALYMLSATKQDSP